MEKPIIVLIAYLISSNKTMFQFVSSLKTPYTNFP